MNPIKDFDRFLFFTFRAFSLDAIIETTYEATILLFLSKKFFFRSLPLHASALPVIPIN